MSSMSKSLLIVTLVAVFCPKDAFAYLEPGTGSMLLQLLLGGLGGAAVIGKLYWHRLKYFFLRKDIKSNDAAAGDSPSE